MNAKREASGAKVSAPSTSSTRRRGCRRAPRPRTGSPSRPCRVGGVEEPVPVRRERHVVVLDVGGRHDLHGGRRLHLADPEPLPPPLHECVRDVPAVGRDGCGMLGDRLGCELLERELFERPRGRRYRPRWRQQARAHQPPAATSTTAATTAAAPSGDAARRGPAPPRGPRRGGSARSRGLP